MEPPPVQYVTTSDGYSIAYAARGAGLPFVFMPGPASHLQLFPSQHFINSWSTALSKRYRVIQYDGRGQGMSQRSLSADYGMDAPQRDLEAVVDRLQLDRFVLMGSHASGHTAVRYAIENPRRVHALVLAPCATSGRTWSVVSAIELARSNWDFFLATWIVAFDRGSSGEERAEIARLRECMTQRDWEIMATAWVASDIEELLPALRTPTLLLHPHDYHNIPVEESMKLASRITNARFALIDGKSPLGDAIQGTRTIDDFLASLGDIDAGNVSKKPGSVAGLSARESEVLRLIARGLSNQQIADELVIALSTVTKHVGSILGKTGASNRTEAATHAPKLDIT